MEKKLTSQGAKGRESFTITLPKEWILAEKLEKNKTVDLEVAGNKVIISAQKKDQNEFIINAEEADKGFQKMIPSLYRLGINQITFTEIEDSHVEIIHDILRKKLIGFEVVEQSKDKITIKYIMKESEEDFKVILRRIFLLLLELSTNQSETHVKTLEKNIQRLTNYCARILITKGHEEFLKIPVYYLLIDQLDKLNDELSETLSRKLNKKQIGLLNDFRGQIDQAYSQFYKFKLSEYNSFIESNHQFILKIRLSDHIETSTMHIHNAARILSAIYGSILALNSDKISIS